MFNQISAVQDLGNVLPEVLHVTMQAVDGVEGSLFLTDENRSLKEYWLVENGELVNGDELFLKIIVSEGLAGHVLKSNEAVVIDDTREDERWMPRRGHLATTTAWSAVCVPLMAHGETKGVMTIARPGAEQYSDEAKELMLTIANQIAIAVGNGDLQGATRRHADDLASLVAAAAAISSTLDMEQVYRIVAEQIAMFANVDACAVADYNPQNKQLFNRAIYSFAEELNLTEKGLTNLIESPFIRDILNVLRPMQAAVDTAEIDEPLQHLLTQFGFKYIFALPLTAQNQIIGIAILLDRERTQLFDDSQLSLVQTLGTQTAIAIQNARLYSETQRQLSVTKLLNEASQVINSSLDLQQIMQSLLTQMNEFLRSEAVSIALLDKASQELVFTVAEGIGSAQIKGMRMPADQGVAGWVLQHNTPALVNDTRSDTRHHQQGDQRTGHPTKAMICAPITVKGKVLGTIQAINPIQKSSFSDNELDVLMNLANLASSAMNNAQQYTKTQAAESRYMGLFQDSIDPIILTDKIGNILEVNSRACELLEYDRRELIRLRINNLHPVETGLLGERSFQPIQTRQIKMFTSEIITKNKRRTPVEVYAKRIYMGDNQILQWIYHDITEQVELEQMREDLTAMLFHDLQSPLGNVISSLELAMEDIPPDTPSSMSEMLDVAIKSTDSLQRLVKSLLDVNRLEAGHPISNQSFYSMADLLDEAHNSIQATLDRRRITIERQVPLFMPNVYIDDDMIRRVLINLMDNALKFSQDGQIITLEVSEPQDDYITISVSDQGPGIPRKYRDIIFEKFRRIQEQQPRKGIGLGLAFCRLAVEAHKGKIWVDSGPRGGARFNFTLPISDNTR